MSSERTPDRVAVEQIALAAVAISEQSIKEAEGSGPEYIEDGSGEVWSLVTEKRAQAIAFYAREMGIDFTEVRCTRRYMRLDLQAIRSEAAALAFDLWENGELGERTPTACTWEGEGWLFEDCEAKDARAIPMWRCEAKPLKTAIKGPSNGT